MNEELEILRKFTQTENKKNRGGGGGGREGGQMGVELLGGQGGCERNVGARGDVGYWDVNRE